MNVGQTRVPNIGFKGEGKENAFKKIMGDSKTLLDSVHVKENLKFPAVSSLFERIVHMKSGSGKHTFPAIKALAQNLIENSKTKSPEVRNKLILFLEEINKSDVKYETPSGKNVGSLQNKLFSPTDIDKLDRIRGEIKQQQSQEKANAREATRAEAAKANAHDAQTIKDLNARLAALSN
jgi:hypothetical protein